KSVAKVSSDGLLNRFEFLGLPQKLPESGFSVLPNWSLSELQKAMKTSFQGPSGCLQWSYDVVSGD
ncbi:hypothetical protein, partial [Pseudomonas aeruginosa]|uniref:hypothetical protein n=1 Tax=Pseudomonas aeruginosa TaxID=287 RepID=UPI0034580275